MLSLNDREWKEFLVKDILDSFNSKAYHSENLLFLENAATAYITRTASDNGLFGLTDTMDGTYEINPANTISFGAETAEFFYQSFPYITGNKMYYLKSDLMTKYSGLFFVTELRKGIKSCFSYANGAIPSRVVRKKIMLPINIDENPDYDFMEAYIRQQKQDKVNAYIQYCKNCLSKLRSETDIGEITQKEWHEFFVDDIFTIDSGKRLESYNMTAGSRPFIGATDSGNGVTNYISNENESLDSNVLGVNYNGNGMVISFYHPYECLFSDDVKRFHLKNHPDNKYVLLFFKTLILQQKAKYNYGYKFNATRMKRQKIMIPVTESGEPDYDYMAQYAKNMMIRKYQQYLDYIEK